MFKKLGAVSAAVLLTLTALLPIFKDNYLHAAAEPSPWIDATSFSLDKIRDLNTGELPQYSINGNRDCHNRKVITRSAKPLLGQSEQSHTSCVGDTAFGAISATGYLQRPGTTVSGEVRTPSGSKLNLIPIPYSTTSLRMGSPGANGVNLYFTNSYETNLQTSSIITGEVTHTAPPDYTSALKDRAGNLLWAQTDSIAFSADGNWMLVDIAFIGTVRVNLQTFEVLPFGDSFNYNIGLTPSIQSAISSNGRYAVVSSRSFGRFKIYDLSTCAAIPVTITGPVNCKSRDLLPFMKQQLSGFGAASTIRFDNDNALRLYADYKNAVNQTQIGQFVLKIPGTDVASFEYLGLGDSFSSGEGAYNYKPMTDTNINKCHLSQKSYPYLLAKDLNLSTFESVACSGAVINDIFNRDKDYKGQVKDGIKFSNRNVDELLTAYSPGAIPQFKFTEYYQPNVITLSTVGNDIGFADKIKRCLEPDTCFSTYEDRLEIVREINSQFDRLTNMYWQLKNAGNPRSKIYAIGYPQIAKLDGNCALNVHLNNQEIAFSETLISYLNSVIKQAAANAGVAYIDVEDALVGHRLCENNSTEIAVNGLTAGNDIVDFLVIHGPIGNESFHPNAYGHSLMEQKILERTLHFGLVMPAADPSIGPPAESADLPILNVAKSGRAINQQNYDSSLTDDVVYRQTALQAVINTSKLVLKTASPFHILLNSNPIDLGTFNSTATGQLSFQFTIPTDVPTGYHTLHVYGQNVAGEPVDIYKTIYVAANSSDLDGDGITNSQDACPTIENSNTDYDKDEIDDACDGLITDPPVVQTPPETSDPIVPNDSSDTSNEQVQTPENDPETTAEDKEISTALQTYFQPGLVSFISKVSAPVIASATQPKALSSLQPTEPKVEGTSTEPNTAKNSENWSTLAVTPKLATPKFQPWFVVISLIAVLIAIIGLVKKFRRP